MSIPNTKNVKVLESSLWSLEQWIFTLTVRQVEGEWELKLVEGEEKMPKYAVWSGDEESDIILNIFNNNFDKLPEKEKS